MSAAPTSGRPFIVPIFLPHAGCRHRCVFCNPKAIGAGAAMLSAPAELRHAILDFLPYRQPQPAATEIAFYGGSFLDQPHERLIAWLGEAARAVEAGLAGAIRFSARPDSIDAERLALLADYPVRTIELGVPCLEDRVLAICQRGHTARDVFRAVERLKSRGYRVGLQLMAGLPGETRAGSLTSVQRAAALSPDLVRLHPTLVLSGTPLERLYRQRAYVPLPLTEAIAWSADLVACLQAHRVPIARLGLQATEALDSGRALVAGPYHPAFGHLVYCELMLRRGRDALAAISSRELAAARLYLHPRSLSRLHGADGRGLATLRDAFGLTRLQVYPDTDMAPDTLRAEPHAEAGAGLARSGR